MLLLLLDRHEMLTRVDQTVRAKWWRVPAAEVPRSSDHAAQERWLYDWWQRIDTWITQNRPSGVTVAQGAPPP